LLQRARWAVSLLAVLLLAVLGAGVWALAGRATRELERLAAEVATIEAGSLARRLTPGSTHEVDRLVRVLNRVLERLERSVAQLQRFTADAAHELRTPLAAIRARLEVALYRDAGEVPRDVVVDVLEQTEHLHRLAEGLLMLARVEGGAVRAETMDATVDVSRIVDEVGAAMAPVAEEQGRPFRWRAVPGLVVRGSEPLLKRVILNLVDNAFRHTPASAAVAIDAHRDGTQAVVDVCDAGPGVDPALAPHLFERFRHGTGGGAGLGLALVREIVERHGGSVSLETSADGGTDARVALPLD
jgi:signal transduction histidine kinase